MIPAKEPHPNYRRCFQIAGISIQVGSDLPITAATFHPKFNQFAVSGSGADVISIHHHFFLPDFDGTGAATEVYRTPPWRIFKREQDWIYQLITAKDGGDSIYQAAVAATDHSRTQIYHSDQSAFRDGGNHSLTLFPTDQILLARVLAERNGCYFHSAGVILDHKGLLLAGHSAAGKSTAVKNLSGSVQILCDDRMIVRNCGGQFRIYGTWSNGEVRTVSGSSAPLQAILFLEQAQDCRLVPINDRKEIAARLLSLLIKPLVSADWWEKMLKLVAEISCKVPCYRLRFSKNDNPAHCLKLIGKGSY